MHHMGFLSCFVITCIFAQSAWSLVLNNKVEWSWVDESCNDRLEIIGTASKEYFELAKVSYSSLGDATTEETRATLKTFYGTVDVGGRLIQSQYKKLKDLGGGTTIPYSIYCDGSAFKYVDGKNEEGEWVAIRSDPKKSAPDIKVDRKLDNICDHPDEPNAISSIHGNAILLCPRIFEKRAVIGSLRDEVQQTGTTLNNMVSISSILLHEITHLLLGTRDHRYGVLGCILLAQEHPFRTRMNADSFKFFAMAIYLNKNDWSRLGAARPRLS